MIGAHHEAAAAKGLRIVPCCGFDSIPFDLGALLVRGWRAVGLLVGGTCSSALPAGQGRFASCRQKLRACTCLASGKQPLVNCRQKATLLTRCNALAMTSKKLLQWRQLG